MPNALRLFLVAAALSTWGPYSAAAADVRAEIVTTDLGFPEGTVFVGNDLYFVDYVRSSVRKRRGVDGMDLN